MNPQRTLAAVLATALVVAPPLAGQKPAAPAAATREARVLALLRQVPVEHANLMATPTATQTNTFGCKLVVPAVGGLCGFGWEPAFDPPLARRLARELCTIYGLAPAADAAAPAGQAATLDSFDAATGIGLKLRGSVVDKPLPTGGTWPTVVDEPAATDLDTDEHRALTAAQCRVHIAAVNDYWTAGSGDRLTTTLCYLATVAAFLDDVTAGDDVDLSAITGGRTNWIRVERPKLPAGVRIETFGGGMILGTDRQAEVVFAVDPKHAFDPATSSPVAPIANAGRPVVMTLGVSVEGGRSPLPGAFRLLLRQKNGKGSESELASSDNEFLFAPAAFDVTRPFRLVLTLQPGFYRLHDSVRVSAPAAAR